MTAGDGIRSALQSIFSHKLRSLLTLTGIVIGVLAVVTMFSSVYALKKLIKDNMEGMGWNYSVIITAEGGERIIGPRTMRRAIRRTAQNVKTISYDDFVALRDGIPHRSIYGMIESNSLHKVKGKDKFVRVRATNPEFFGNKSYPILKGRYFTDRENELLLPVAVLGYYFAQDRFGDKNPVGQELALGQFRYRIVGVLDKDKLSSGNGMNFNNYERKMDLEAVYVPLKYGATYFGTTGGVHMIYLQAHSEAGFATMKRTARQLLLSRHNMYPNFSFMDIGDMLLTINKEIDDQMRKWNITLSAIASISLLVGGIGLFSTLLISIQERMTEIGVRKSIGATDSSIFFYFLYEAVALALGGALLGILLAWLILTSIGKAIHFPLYLPIAGVGLGTFFSLLVGVVSGLYPAIKAAQIDPIRAIYYMD